MKEPCLEITSFLSMSQKYPEAHVAYSSPRSCFASVAYCIVPYWFMSSLVTARSWDLFNLFGVYMRIAFSFFSAIEKETPATEMLSPTPSFCSLFHIAVCGEDSFTRDRFYCKISKFPAIIKLLHPNSINELSPV